MQEGIYIAASGAFKQEKKLDLIANNLANLGNTAYKRDALLYKEKQGGFRSVLDMQVQPPRLFPEHPQGGASYVGVSGFYTDSSQGTLKHTGSTLDLAVEGEGYFVVETARGNRYTRNGNFILDGKGYLATQEGNRVLNDKNKPVQIDALGGQITIDAKGSITVSQGLNNTPIGNLKLVKPGAPENLSKEGNGLYRLAGGGEEQAAEATLKQGFLELSNVNSVEEMTSMIATLRAFEAYQKVIQSIDQADDLAVNSIGRLA